MKQECMRKNQECFLVPQQRLTLEMKTLCAGIVSIYLAGLMLIQPVKFIHVVLGLVAILLEMHDLKKCLTYGLVRNTNG